MGIIKAAQSMLGGSLGDQWLEVIEPSDMDFNTVACPGVAKARNDSRNTNLKGTAATISNGSIIHVYPEQMMLLVDGGAVVDYTCEEGYYEVKNSSLPSLMNGQFGDTLKETFNRFRFGGVTPTSQRVIYLNLRPITGIMYGTSQTIDYHDQALNLYGEVMARGKFAIEITNPILFYKKVIPPSVVMNGKTLTMDDIYEQRYDMKFLDCLSDGMAQLSDEGVSIAKINKSKGRVKEIMKERLKEDWDEKLGFGLYDLDLVVKYSRELQQKIDERSEMQFLNDPSMRETMMQKNISEGIKAAGSNSAGAMTGFMGVGMGMNAMGGFMGNASNANMQQMQMQQQQQMQQPQIQQPQMQQPQAAPAGGWDCACGYKGNTGKFCANCGQPKPVPAAGGAWKCSCGQENTTKFCANCGQPRPAAAKKVKCDKCGYEPDMSQPIPKFCPNCGDAINEADMV